MKQTNKKIYSDYNAGQKNIHSSDCLIRAYNRRALCAEPRDLAARCIAERTS